MKDFTIIKIKSNRAADIARQFYGIEGSIEPLPGELDFNFKITTDKNRTFILKVSRPDEKPDYLNFQQELLLHLEQKNCGLIVPKVIKNKEDKYISTFKDKAGNKRYVRLITYIPGRLYSDINPKCDLLKYSLGEQCGSIALTLKDFDHPCAYRTFEWDIAQSLWTEKHLSLFPDDKREIIEYFQGLFKANNKSYGNLRKGLVHNDANDYNVIVDDNLISPKVRAIIDYGDAIYTQIINDLAVACAYAIMNQNNPLASALPIVKGFHNVVNLMPEELEHLYTAIAMRLVISVTKSAMNKILEQDNEYLQVSEKPAWDVLYKWKEILPHFALYSFRAACGFTPHPNEDEFKQWANCQSFSLNTLFSEVQNKEIYPLDLSVSSTWLGHQQDYNNPKIFQFKLEQLQSEHPDKILAGGYLEPRYFYDTHNFSKPGDSGCERRTIHLGIDFWMPHNTAVHALYDGEVITAVNQKCVKGYGGLLIIKHTLQKFCFYTLYGHLSKKSIDENKLGKKVKAGEKIGSLGNFSENGNWIPHLHFQLLLDCFNLKDDFPGVGYHSQINVMKSVCPDPNLLFKSTALLPKQENDKAVLKTFRKKHLGKSLSLQYKEPLKIVRGDRVYLIDENGRKYLDTVNNVAHVGHENYRVVKAIREQISVLNTNSRYLHENINKLAGNLLEILPEELSVLHFVNSGSEANELAIRMVKAVTGSREFIVSEVGYHGNSNACIDISSYKFDGKGGSGAPEHTHVFPLPDVFRGKYRGRKSESMYVKEVEKLIDGIHKKNRKVGALMVEPIISCGGQIELPQGFLLAVYKAVRKAGGLCISDEVQVGCGRVGETFWGFQLHGVVPDIVTIGKPLGNGHPLAAVVCTQRVAEKFANGMEYFNTFGGNPVSCAAGNAVLETVKYENLQAHALKVGTYLKHQLDNLSKKFPIIGHVRGHGLFLGVELVDAQLNPLPEHADYLVNRMKDHGVLMSADGLDNNVIKIKPPMVFSQKNADTVLLYLEKILRENFMTNY
ncbi:MAG: peptidase M23 [Flavobacteriales bacterium]|nr:MAG: peptidase M23 [Flavobacteriales bacterium]